MMIASYQETQNLSQSQLHSHGTTVSGPVNNSNLNDFNKTSMSSSFVEQNLSFQNSQVQNFNSNLLRQQLNGGVNGGNLYNTQFDGQINNHLNGQNNGKFLTNEKQIRLQNQQTNQTKVTQNIRPKTSTNLINGTNFNRDEINGNIFTIYRFDERFQH